MLTWDTASKKHSLSVHSSDTSIGRTKTLVKSLFVNKNCPAQHIRVSRLPYTVNNTREEGSARWPVTTAYLRGTGLHFPAVRPPLLAAHAPQ